MVVAIGSELVVTAALISILLHPKHPETHRVHAYGGQHRTAVVSVPRDIGAFPSIDGSIDLYVVA